MRRNKHHQSTTKSKGNTNTRNTYINIFIPRQTIAIVSCPVYTKEQPTAANPQVYNYSTQKQKET